MKKENENAALLSMFDDLVNEVKKNRQAILQLQNIIKMEYELSIYANFSSTIQLTSSCSSFSLNRS